MPAHALARYPYLPPQTYPLLRHAWRARLECRHERTCRAASYLACGDTHGLAQLARVESRSVATYAAAQRWALGLTAGEARCRHCHRPLSRRNASITAEPRGDLAQEIDLLHYLLSLALREAPDTEWIERVYDHRGTCTSWRGWAAVEAHATPRLTVVGEGSYPFRSDWTRMAPGGGAA